MADAATTSVPVEPAHAVVPVRPAPAAVRWLCLAGLLGVLTWPVLLAIMFIRLGGPDFEYFYKAGRSITEYGTFDPGYDRIDGQIIERGTLDWYWPFVHRLMSVLAHLPYRVAGYVWITINVTAILATIWMLGRHLSGLPPQDWAVTQLVPVILLLIYWVWELRLNQINALTLLLMVGSYVAWERGRKLQSGFWLGLAVLLKITPGLLVLWLLLKREWRTAGATIVTIALAGPVSDAVVFGPQLARETYQDWVFRSVMVGSPRGLILSQREMDWRNQALGAVVCRWLHPASYASKFDNDPRVDRDYRATTPRTINLVELPRSTVATIASGLALAILLTLAWIARRPASQLPVWRLRAEWTLFLLGMLCLMPVMRLYHVIWALPALTVLGGLIHHTNVRSGWSRFAITCILLGAITQLALIPQDKALNAGGTVLLAVVLLAMPLVAALVRTTPPAPAAHQAETTHA